MHSTQYVPVTNLHSRLFSYCNVIAKSVKVTMQAPTALYELLTVTVDYAVPPHYVYVASLTSPCHLRTTSASFLNPC